MIIRLVSCALRNRLAQIGMSVLTLILKRTDGRAGMLRCLGESLRKADLEAVLHDEPAVFDGPLRIVCQLELVRVSGSGGAKLSFGDNEGR
jgi:hypothetical protein